MKNRTHSKILSEEKVIEKRLFIISIVISILLQILGLFIYIWQYSILPGIIAGLINKKASRSIIASAIGVLSVWIPYMLFAFTSKNTFLTLDYFATLIFGELGYGPVLLIVILCLGTILGALGGAIGYGTHNLLCLKQSNESKIQIQ
ncbi:MAG: hypothetical protein JW891_15405 [Candidatus Lokiarchaeota archaeon]|nr:hypothetical protein [Candidatus Lokiarchaeota archaeon]